MVTPVIGNEFLKGACNIVEDILRVNVGGESAVHPVVRTNPISGWKSISPIGSFPAQFNGLTRRESANMLQWFHDMITYGHDIQVRFKWNQPNDIAIWDNRRVFHTATGDHEDSVRGAVTVP
ncbi:alpha-ketoglutarate-dependent sulfonate dioxygenase, putative [Aspergillus udagawae]|uniref:Alpha-ketoglutarate-dependent sulfonate dioxygenase, putative n=1 Tax=Aspergillus udagawae TaxID=91492 RepID=A0ABQ1AI00_9EURO|nr:alpha-ketoglutarate-dependent sulfonate dioxygenase, putative [Aspergillus udagawae]GFF82249.1 alpha-ketoglutarate-dependent sulfonate dioxygenase, putative [Aspergillus udagawae]GFG05790.1 alpha-ketoglutarate-dependent sulfonate dioxygenase, putative [Aspergillus udagawae]